MKLENNLGTDPVKSLVWRIAIPSMLAQFVSVLYSIVDRIYISNIPVVGYFITDLLCFHSLRRECPSPLVA